MKKILIVEGNLREENQSFSDSWNSNTYRKP